MLYPSLKKLRQSTVSNKGFFGVDFREKIQEGYFSDMENLSGEKFPIMSVKRPGAVWTGVTQDEDGMELQCDGSLCFDSKGITAVKTNGDKLCYCTGSRVFVNGKRVLGALLQENVEVRTIVPFGKNCFIVPDGEYITDYPGGGYQAEHTCTYFSSRTAGFYFCDENGGELEGEYDYNAPQNPVEGDMYIEALPSGMMLYEYNSSGEWKSRCQLYIKISAEGIGTMFSVNDRLYVPDTYFENGECVIRAVRDMNTIIVSGKLFGEISNFANFTAQKKIPAMDFAVEHNNRIWGCRYGKSNNGSFVNEIYACAQGDPGSWECFEGTSMDSYRVSLGCPGEFTGAAVLGSDVLFFKEEYIIRISGDTPSDFSVTVFCARGVQRGCHNSIVNMNEQLFYKSRYGVMMYDGTFPVEISEALGDKTYSDAVAQGIDNKYYIAMTDSLGERSMFVYHTHTGLWYREDDRKNTRFIVRIRNCLYFICCDADDVSEGRKYYSFRLSDEAKISQAVSLLSPEETSAFLYMPEKRVHWFAETGRTGDDALPVRQILRRIHITLKLGRDSVFSIYILPDNETQWKRLCYIDTPVDKVFTIPVNTPACHSYRLRFEGEGSCRIMSVVRQSEITTEVRNIG